MKPMVKCPFCKSEHTVNRRELKFIELYGRSGRICSTCKQNYIITKVNDEYFVRF